MRNHVDFNTKEKALVPQKLCDLSWEKVQKQIQYGGRRHCLVETVASSTICSSDLGIKELTNSCIIASGEWANLPVADALGRRAEYNS
eukprot:12977789-Ditylum_brightwellii.AAC.1